ncbi:hypothetical protein EON80_02180 [bacterium]|nr:MAG: hypothetical protein EON80_02180 [bacterium]
MSLDKLTVLVSSFDGFDACWPPFSHGMKRYWPGSPPIRLLTNFKHYEDGQVKALPVGADQGWSDNIRTALQSVETPFVLYIQEDYWLQSPVDSAKLGRFVDLMEEHGGNYLRLIPCPPPDADSGFEPEIGLIAAEAEYRTSLQAAIWRVETLRELLVAGESAWDFELVGTPRSRNLEGFWSVKTDAIDYLNSAIVKGRWIRPAFAWAKRENFQVEWGKRQRETWWHEFLRSGEAGRIAGILAHKVNYLLKPERIVQKLKARSDTRENVK